MKQRMGRVGGRFSESARKNKKTTKEINARRHAEGKSPLAAWKGGHRNNPHRRN